MSQVSLTPPTAISRIEHMIGLKTITSFFRSVLIMINSDF